MGAAAASGKDDWAKSRTQSGSIVNVTPKPGVRKSGPSQQGWSNCEHRIRCANGESDRDVRLRLGRRTVGTDQVLPGLGTLIDSSQSESEDLGFDLFGESDAPSARTVVTTAAKGHQRRSSAVVFRRSFGGTGGTTVTAVGLCAGALDRLGRVFFEAAFGSSLDRSTQPDWEALATASGTSKVFSGFLREPAMFSGPVAGGNQPPTTASISFGDDSETRRPSTAVMSASKSWAARLLGAYSQIVSRLADAYVKSRHWRMPGAKR